MSAVAAAVLAASVAAIAGVFARRRLRRAGRTPPSTAASGLLSAALARRDLAGSLERRGVRRLPLLLGAGMMAVSIPTGVALLRVEPAPTAEPDAVGVVPPVGGQQGNGFALGMATTVRGCGERVDVKLVATGTAEYWRANGERLPDWSTFALALPGTDLTRLHVGLSDNAPDITLPMGAKPEQPEWLHGVRARTVAGHTVVSGQVFGWEKHLNALVATFSADWLEGRGFGLCSLRLPALTGGLTVLAAQEARGRVVTAGSGPAQGAVQAAALAGTPHIRSGKTRRSAPYDRELETTLATSTVVGEGADVLPEPSLPGPDQTFQGHPTWVCETSRPLVRGLDTVEEGKVADIEPGTRTAGAAYGRRYLKERRGEDCSAVVAMQESDAGVWRDGLLVVLGAIFSLGAAIFVETLLDWRGRVRARAPT